MAASKNRVYAYFTAALCLTGFFFCAAHTQEARAGVTAQAEGLAEIGKGGRNEARQAALKDALQQAAMSVESRVMASEHLSADNEPLQSLRVRPTQEVTRYSILREWEDQGIFHVTVSAEVGQGKAMAAGCAASAPAPKKKIVFVQFDVANSIQVDDIKNILGGLPSELASRLEASGEFLSTYVQRSIPRESDMQKREAIKFIAEESGAQFVVSGMIVDAGVSQVFLGYEKRNFEIEFSVYDVLTGTRVLLRHLEEHAQGNVMVGRDKPFGSRAFFETGLGRAADQLLDVATQDIRVALECLPFSAHIIRIEEKKVFLDAGGTSLLRPGDQLVAFVRNSTQPIVGLGGAVLGETERPVATVTLIKVQPQFAIGELSENAATLGIKVGDIVRFELADGN